MNEENNIVSVREIDPASFSQETTPTSTGSEAQPEQTTTEETQETQSTSEESSAGSEESSSTEAQGGASKPAKEEVKAPEVSAEEQVTKLTEKFTNGEFKDPAKLYEAYTQLKAKTNQNPLDAVSPFVKGLIEYEKAGGDPKTYVEIQSLDFSKMEPKEILRQKFIKDNPDMDKKVANVLFERNFKKEFGALSDESISDDEKDELTTVMNYEVGKATKELEKWKADNAVIQKDDKGQDAEQQAFFDKHFKAVDDRMAKFNGLDVNIKVDEKTTEKFNYAATPEQKQMIKNWMRDPFGEAYTALFNDEQGNVDYSKMERFFMYASDPDGYTSKLYNHGFTKGQEALVAKRKNQTQPGITPQGSVTNLKSSEDQLTEKWLNL
jgi:hypothetical protein